VALIGPTRDGRLAAYSAVTAAGLLAGVVTSRLSAVAVVIPFAITLAIGARHRGAVRVDATITIARGQILEGDRVEGTISITRPPGTELELLLRIPPGMEAIEPAELLAWDVPPGAANVDLPFAVTADRWGRHRIGTLHARFRYPSGLITWEGEITRGPELRVLPSAERLDRLLDPAVAHASAGVHRSKRIADGTEFADIRAYQPGDRLRDLNWQVTNRRGAPHVNLRHPERSAEVIVLVDTFTDSYVENSVIGQEALAHCARAAWGLGRAHLAAQDRVGFLAYGRVGTALTSASGARARYRLLETMLSVGGAVAAGSSEVNPLPERVVPPAALLIAITPLFDDRLVAVLQSLRARGRAVAAVVLDVKLPAAHSAADEMARRLWELDLEGRRDRLRNTGIPTVVWDPTVSLAHIVRRVDDVRAGMVEVRR
jgi:uncharacterized protein (DUF58 family)